jgi:hypothetical protein
MDITFIDFVIVAAIAWFCWLGKRMVDFIEKDEFE